MEGLDLSCNETNLYKKLSIALNLATIENIKDLQELIDNLELNQIINVKTVIGVNDHINLSDINYDVKSIKLIKYSLDENNSAKIWNDIVENYIETDFVLIGKGINKIITKFTKYERFIKILDEIPNMQIVKLIY
jgi:pantothenate kinase